MTCGELFVKDPTSWRIVNEGVSSNNALDEETLKYELSTFVCQGEYKDGLERILRGYLASYGAEQKAVWVSGFYGSGKSHLVKMLRFLWTNHTFADGTRARSLATLPQDIKDALLELDTRGKQHAGLHSAGGTLSAGIGSVRLRLLGIVLKSVGLPENISQARLILDLRDENHMEAVEAFIRAAGKEPDEELQKLYISKTLHEAYLQVKPHVGDLAQVGAVIRSQYPTKVVDITISELEQLLRRVLGREGQLPCTVIVMDEVQQYINDKPDVAMEVQELVESCSKSLDGRVLFVGTGQSALSDTPSLQKLMGRFTIKAHLKDIDVVKVVRTVVLQKKEDKRNDIDALQDRFEGELARQLGGTKVAIRPEDKAVFAADYPLLPVRRRVWESILHSVDPTGTTAQMRTQLSVIHEACRQAADKPVGAVIPADFIYDQLANNLVISGELQKRFQEIVEEQKEKPEGCLRSRVCAMTYLINKLPREGADIGVRATVDHLADLLSEDLDSSPSELRKVLPELVKQLVQDGVLMDVDNEFRLQTTEGAAWEGEFGNRRRALLNNDARLASQRGQDLMKGVTESLRGLSVLQGQAREKRKTNLHYSLEKPPANDGITIWVRDGFQESEKDVLREIQATSTEDATVHVLIPKARADELKATLASALAAEETLNAKGSPTSSEGKEARSAMQTRRGKEERQVEQILGDILGGARVFLSGGQELAEDILLKDRIQRACEQALVKKYPRFHEADNPNWGLVWKKAKEGNPNALSNVGYQGDPDKHPLAKEILKAVGAGKKGSDLSAQFAAAPYGWPKDALDGLVGTLLISGHLSARKDGKPITVGDMTQRDVGLVDLHVEHPVLTAAQKLVIRKLFQQAGFAAKPGDELAQAPTFIQHLKTLASQAGGEAPAPESPRPPELLQLEALSGNDLLFELHERADTLSQQAVGWKQTEGHIAARVREWHKAQRLLEHATALYGHAQWVATLHAVKANRSLLAEPDPVQPVLQACATALREALTDACKVHQDVFEQHHQALATNAAWKGLSQEDQQRWLLEAGAVPAVEPDTSTDDTLLQALDMDDLAHWQTRSEALPTRFQKALQAAIQASLPKARRVALPQATLQSESEVDQWLAQVREQVLKALSDGPVIF